MLQIPKKLRAAFRIVVSCLDGLLVYVGCYYVFSRWLSANPDFVDFVSSYFGVIGEWLVKYSPIWLPIPAAIGVAWELTCYRLGKLKKKVAQTIG